MKAEYIEKIYAGWLAKIIGIRLGAPIEGWTYEKIKNIYGDIHDYPVKYREFAADDDSNGPIFFLRALEDSSNGFAIEANDVADALLNYAPYEHGFFWWGGYGISTEHTAYLNLQNGVKAPRSGSMELNGATISEQIGGQIFIDSWGLVAPGNTDLAAEYATKAASVTHDGNGIYGGIFIAVCISHAFDETDINTIIEKGLSYIPDDCEYARVVNAVVNFHHENPGSWRDAYKFISDNFGYDKYVGNCHIIPNTAVIILALLYGGGDFSETLNICNMCGWDTDCNVGNIATIMGVRGGLSAIEYEKWRLPINDFLACSSTIGSLNIMDIPYVASYIARLAYAISGETPPAPWKEIFAEKIADCHFEYPGSTHAIRARSDDCASHLEYTLINTDEAALTGSRSLKLVAKPLNPGERIYLYKKTYYTPQDFDDSRYDPSFSPVLYPGQTITAGAFLPEYANSCIVRLYAHDMRSDKIFESEGVHLKKGEWSTLSFTLPSMEGALIDESGLIFDMCGEHGRKRLELVVMIDDLCFSGIPQYSIEFSKENTESWTPVHNEVSQFTRLKGLLYLCEGNLHISCADYAEAYTGHHDWKDYSAAFAVTPVTGNNHLVNFRVQGAIRSYAAGFTDNGKFGLYKNSNGYKLLTETDFSWKIGQEYIINISADKNTVSAEVNNKKLSFTDNDHPYLKGLVGISVRNGSHSCYRSINLKGI